MSLGKKRPFDNKCGTTSFWWSRIWPALFLRHEISSLESKTSDDPRTGCCFWSGKRRCPLGFILFHVNFTWNICKTCFRWAMYFYILLFLKGSDFLNHEIKKHIKYLNIEDDILIYWQIIFAIRTYSRFKCFLCDLQVSNSQGNISKNFANYFLKTKANTKCFTMLKCTCKGLQKSVSELER